MLSKLRSYINHLLPYAYIDVNNPVFEQQKRHIRWLSSPQNFRNFNIIVLVSVPLVVGVWWFLERLGFNFGYVQPDFENRLITTLVIISLCLMLATSMYSVPATIGSLNSQFSTAQWEMLRLTNQPEREVVVAEDAINQLRMWPFILLEVALRFAIAGVFVATSFYNLRLGDPTSHIQRTFRSPVCWIGWVLVLAGLIIEPIIRERVIIAICAAVAFRIKTLSLALLVGLLGTLLLQIGQLWVMHLLWDASTGVFEGDSGVEFAFLFGFLPYTIFVLGAFYFAASIIRDTALGFAQRNVFISS